MTSAVLAPVLTPFDQAYRPDAARLVSQCHCLLAAHVDLVLFGTTSEANSLSGDERRRLLEAVLGSGVDPTRVMVGTGCCALPDTVALTAHAVKAGCAGALVLPPFYYKGVSDEGLFRSYAQVVEHVNDPRLKIYLYHIPPVSQVGISPALIERLRGRYPGVFAGIKDSSGDWSNTRALLQLPDLAVYTGTETQLLATMRRGGKGCITATANVNPEPILRLAQDWRAPDAEAQQEALTRFRTTLQSFSTIPALKALLAHRNGDPGWSRLRPPLVELTPDQSAALVAAVAR